MHRTSDSALNSYLEDNLVSTKGLGDLILGLVVGNQLVGRRHVNAVDIGVSDSGSAGCKVDLLCTSITGHLNNLLGGCSANNGVYSIRRRKDISMSTQHEI